MAKYIINDAPNNSTLSYDVQISTIRNPKKVHWEPKPDITAYELALALPAVLGTHFYREDLIEALPKEHQRHWRIEEPK